MIGSRFCKKLVKNVSVKWNYSAQLHRCLEPTHCYQQEPPESQTHVHVAEYRIYPEYLTVQQRFGHDLDTCVECRTGE